MLCGRRNISTFTALWRTTNALLQKILFKKPNLIGNIAFENNIIPVKQDRELLYI